MRKLIAAAAIVTVFAACNGTATTEVTTDSTAVKVDTLKVDSLKVVADTTKKVDTVKAK
jgi:hypothetical protein